MKYNKTKKIIVILASFAVLVCALCTTTFASWSVATQNPSGNIARVLNITMNNNLNLALDTTFNYENRTYAGQILIENFGNTYFNLANLEHSNTQSSEMENLFSLTVFGASTERVGYSYYQSGMYNYNPSAFNQSYSGYAGVATTIYGFPQYTYDSHSVRIESLESGEYFAPASSVGFGNQNIRIYFPNESSYNRLYTEVKGTSTSNVVTLRVQHYYSIDGYEGTADGSLTRKSGLYTYTHFVDIPPYTNLSTAYEPTTKSNLRYITFPAQAPWSSIRSYCEREFDRYIFGNSIHLSHSIQFSTLSFTENGDTTIKPDLANTLLSITDNNAYGGTQIPDRQTPYIRDLALEHRSAIQDIDFGTWIGNAVQGFFDVEILPSFTFLDIFVSGLSLLLLVAFLRMFAGG